MPDILDAKLAKLEGENEEAERGGRVERIAKHHASGRLTAREQIAILLDEGSLSLAYAEKSVKILDRALRNGAPVCGLNDSGRARIQAGVQSLAVHSPAITDFVFIVEDTSCKCITGPAVIKSVTHAEVTKEELGGAKTHSSQSGSAHFTASDDEECLLLMRQLFGYLPSNIEDDPDRCDTELNRMVPGNPDQPCDMKLLIKVVVDDGLFFHPIAEPTRKALVQDYQDRYTNPYQTAELGYVDEIIESAQTRPKLIRALEACKNKRDRNPSRKHGNLPL